MSNTNKYSPKSILKKGASSHNHNTSNSWFSKFNNASNDSSRINSLFSGFRSSTSRLNGEDDNLSSELMPREIRRVRFPIHDMTTEYKFNQDETIDLNKSTLQQPTKPISIKTSSQLLSLYETICRNKQEPTIDSFVTTLITHSQATFLNRLDLTNQPIDRHTISPLADVLCIDFGIKELILNNCRLEDDAIKILMHSLLQNDRINQLELANNSKLTTIAFKYIAVYIKGSCQLTTLNLSYTQPDKRSIQYITTATLKDENSSPSLFNLILDGCNLRTSQLEVLAANVKKPESSLKQLSICNNNKGSFSQNGVILTIGVMLRDYDNTGGGLEQLYLDGNDLSQSDSIQYIAQALRRNQRLSVLSMRNCRMDAKGCTMIGEALKYNQHLIKLDISCNPICNNLDGIICIKQALNVNHCLQDLCLADTGLDTEGTIALAESFSENNSLVRLDLTKNPRIGIAGVMALSASIKMNQMITCIDINIAANDEEMVEIHNGLLVTCTRNAQMKKNRNNSIEIQPSESLDNNNNLARLTLEERLAAAVTKNTTNKEDVRMSQLVVKENTDDTLLIQQALDDVGLLEDIEEQKDKTTFNNIYNKCKKTHSSILQRIPEVTNPSHLELFLTINDRLMSAFQAFEAEQQQHIIESVSIIDEQQKTVRDEPFPSSFEIGDDDDFDDDKKEQEENMINLKELRTEIEAEEGAAFLNAKKDIK